jgi:hypothetical protein
MGIDWGLGRLCLPYVFLEVEFKLKAGGNIYNTNNITCNTERFNANAIGESCSGSRVYMNSKMAVVYPSARLDLRIRIRYWQTAKTV